jgi:hypothetical protein
VSAFLLSAVGGTGWETGLLYLLVYSLVVVSWRMVGDWGFVETYVALSADHLVAVELGSKCLERWLDNTTTETEDQVKG